jgi:predicted Ser/Thr protein kinase
MCNTRNATQLISELELGRVSKHAGWTSTIFADAERTVVLKKSKGLYAEFKAFSRETCVLHLLQPFAWAPKLLCANEDFLLMTHVVGGLYGLNAVNPHRLKGPGFNP